MDNNNNNNGTISKDEAVQAAKKAGFWAGFKDGVTDYLGAVGGQVTGVWAKTNDLWDNNHKVLAVANAVVCTPIMAHVAPITGIFAQPDFEKLVDETQKLHDREVKEKMERQLTNAKIVGGLIVAGAMLGIGAKFIKSSRGL